MKKIIIFGLLLTLIILVGCGNGSIKVKNPIQNCRMVDVPYEEQEAYTEQEPYQATEEYQVDLKYEIVSSYKDTTLHGLDVWAESKVKIRNVDSETGVFIVEHTFKTLDGGSETKKSSQYIMPGETKEFIAEVDINIGEDFNSYHSVTPPKKTLTRTVTKYRDVTKYKMVTKYRQEEQCS